MAKVKKKAMDIGPDPEQIGLNVLSDTDERQLLRDATQTFAGQKTFLTPPRCGAFPVLDADVVPKYALMEQTRCTNYTTSEAIDITAEDIARGYAELKTYVVQPQAFEIAQFDGASALVVGRDFSVTPNVDGRGRVVWADMPLGRKIMAGDHMVVRYNTCRPTLLTTLEPEQVFAARIKRDDAGEYTTLGAITEADSGKDFELVRYTDGASVTVKLPTIEPNVTMYAKSLNRKLVLYTQPTFLPPVHTGAEGNELRIIAPFWSGAFRLYEYDFALKAWQLKLTDDFADMRKKLEGHELTEIPLSYDDNNHEVDVVAMNDGGGVALYLSWCEAEKNGAYFGIEGNLRYGWRRMGIACKRYDVGYTLIGSDLLYSGTYYSRHTSIYTHVYATAEKFVPMALPHLR